MRVNTYPCQPTTAERWSLPRTRCGGEGEGALSKPPESYGTGTGPSVRQTCRSQFDSIEHIIYSIENPTQRNNAHMDTDELKALDLNSQDDVEDTEQALGIRFSDFTSEDRRTWRLQELCLKQYALTPDYVRAARRAGVTVGEVKAWERFNVLGFVKRKEIAELEFSDTVQELLLELAERPDSHPALLLALLRKHIPEQFGHIKIPRMNRRTRSKVRRQVAEMHDRIVREGERLLDEEERLVKSEPENSCGVEVRALERVSYWQLDDSDGTRNN